MRHSSAAKRNMVLTIALHMIVLVSTAITAIPGILYGSSSAQEGENLIGVGYFRMFTMDINILAGICALIVVCFAIRSLLKKENLTPAWVGVFRLTVTTGLLLTILTVVFFLAPMDVLEGKSYWGMFSQDLFIYHLSNPLLMIFSFIFLQKETRLKPKDCLWGLVPVAAYTTVYFLMVVVFRKWNDFYGFSLGGKYWLSPVIVIVMLLLTWLLGRLLLRLNRKASGNSAR